MRLAFRRIAVFIALFALILVPPSSAFPGEAWTQVLVMALCLSIAWLLQPSAERIFPRALVATFLGSAAVTVIRVADVLSWNHESGSRVIGELLGAAVGRWAVLGTALAVLVWVTVTDKRPRQFGPGGPLS